MSDKQIPTPDEIGTSFETQERGFFLSINRISPLKMLIVQKILVSYRKLMLFSCEMF